MLVDVRSITGGKPVTLAIHNTGWKPAGADRFQRASRVSKPEVPSSISSVLSKHKVGDVIAVRAQMVGVVMVLHSAKDYKAQEGEFATDSAFFVKAEVKRSRTSSYSTTYVTLVKYGKTSVVPLVQDRTKDARGVTTYVTRPDLVSAVAGLKQGDLVEVDLGKERGRKVVKHIAVWRASKVGRFLTKGQLETDRIKHVTVQIQAADGQTQDAMIQQNSYDGVKYTDDYTMRRFVEKLKADQYVTYKVRTQGDKMIIWLIGTAPKETVDALLASEKGTT